MTNPSTYLPTCPAEFIGPAHKVARMLEAKAKACLVSGEPVKMLFYGSPGLGKTRLAEYFAKLVAGHSTQMESVNGRKLTMDLLEKWKTSQEYFPLHGSYTVKIVNEVDLLRQDQQDFCLSLIDEMKPFTAFIGTSNLSLSEITPRFHSRLQQFKLAAPSTADICGLLKRWLTNESQVNQISVGSGGNVRAALLDCQSVLEMGAI